jgi:hypothetical protein
MRIGSSSPLAVITRHHKRPCPPPGLDRHAVLREALEHGAIARRDELVKELRHRLAEHVASVLAGELLEQRVLSDEHAFASRSAATGSSW